MTRLYPPLRTVFVYGTLMPGERNHPIAQHGGLPHAQTAILPGYRLVHLLPEAYPGILPGKATDLVHGHALTYHTQHWEAALPHLDELEGLHLRPPLYSRQRVTLQLPDGSDLRAWAYVYADHARLQQPGVVPVPGGNWRSIPNRLRVGPREK